MVPPVGMSLQSQLHSQSHIAPPPPAAGSASAYSSSVNPNSIMMARQQRASNSPSRNLTDVRSFGLFDKITTLFFFNNVKKNNVFIMSDRKNKK